MAEQDEEMNNIRLTTMQARKGAIEAVLSMKDQLIKLNAEEFLRMWVLAQAAGDNYCCPGCGPAYQGKTSLGAVATRRSR